MLVSHTSRQESRAGANVSPADSLPRSRCQAPQVQAPSSYRRLDRRELLTALSEREAWPYTMMLSELRQRFGVAETTLRTSLTYAREYGYLQRVEAGWALTPQCRQQLARYGQLEGAEGFRFAAYLSGHPKRGLRRYP